jgi:hypothetical protein
MFLLTLPSCGSIKNPRNPVGSLLGISQDKNNNQQGSAIVPPGTVLPGGSVDLGSDNGEMISATNEEVLRINSVFENEPFNTSPESTTLHFKRATALNAIYGNVFKTDNIFTQAAEVPAVGGDFTKVESLSLAYIKSLRVANARSCKALITNERNAPASEQKIAYIPPTFTLAEGRGRLLNLFKAFSGLSGIDVAVPFDPSLYDAELNAIALAQGASPNATLLSQLNINIDLCVAVATDPLIIFY